MKYINKEQDLESGLRDHGVRKYDEDIGRFTSVDPLWSKYIGWTPYHYCGNDPINASDGNGMQAALQSTKMESYEYLSTTESGQRLAANELAIMGGIAGIGASILFPPLAGASAFEGAVCGINLMNSTYSVVSGTTKMTLDAMGKSKEADDVPGSMGGFIGKGFDETLGNKNKTGESVGDALNSAVSFFSDTKSIFKYGISMILPVASDATTFHQSIKSLIKTNKSTDDSTRLKTQFKYNNKTYNDAKVLVNDLLK